MPEAVTVLVVTHESADVLDDCCASLAAAAPRRGITLTLVDNASTDDTLARAARWVAPERLLRLAHNRGFAAGVNAGLATCETPYVAVLNPDVRASPSSLDALADFLDAHPRAGLVAPRVHDTRGRLEATIHREPTVWREWVHALCLDRLVGTRARVARFPRTPAPVTSASACAWMLRLDAVRAVGPLDEEYFMYYEDVDYCRRLAHAGWDVYAVPHVDVAHAQGTGSRATAWLPADGGDALYRYFARHHARASRAHVRRAVRTGWRVRWAVHALRALAGDARSARLRERYRDALRGRVR